MAEFAAPPLDPAAAAAQAAALKELLRVVSVAQNILISMLAVGIWDWLTTLRDEYERIWKSRWSLVKVLFIATRYTHLIGFTCMVIAWNYPGWEETACRKYQSWSQPLVALGMLLAPECILLIRTLAVWSFSRLVLGGLLAILAFDIGCWLYTIAVGMEPIPFIQERWYCIDANKPDHDGWVCYSKQNPLAVADRDQLFWLGPLIFDLVVVGLLVVKVLPLVRQKTQSDVFKTLLREGLLFYAIITVSNIVNLIFFLQTDLTTNAVNVPISITLTSCLACRLVLSLRDPATQRVKSQTPTTFWKSEDDFSKGFGSTSKVDQANAAGARGVAGKPHEIELQGSGLQYGYRAGKEHLQVNYADIEKPTLATGFAIESDDDGESANGGRGASQRHVV